MKAKGCSLSDQNRGFQSGDSKAGILKRGFQSGDSKAGIPIHSIWPICRNNFWEKNFYCRTTFQWLTIELQNTSFCYFDEFLCVILWISLVRFASWRIIGAKWIFICSFFLMSQCVDLKFRIRIMSAGIRKDLIASEVILGHSFLLRTYRTFVISKRVSREN